MGEDAVHDTPGTCAECGTILCSWAFKGAELCCYCADLALDEMCGPCADMAEVDDG